MSIRLDGRVALVTGASRGLGATMADKLGERGATVAVNYLTNSERANKVVDHIRSRGGTATSFQADVRDEQQVRQMVDDIEHKLGAIDILVISAAGPQPYLPTEWLTWQDCVDQLEYFVKSPLLLVQAVTPGMKKRKYGRVINVGSEVFEKGAPGFANYVSAKGAQLGLTRSWAMELGRYQVTVNHVSPGWIPTERHANEPPEARDAYAAAVPMGHIGDATDVAEAVAFLASDAARFITGQKLAVNGGNSLQ